MRALRVVGSVVAVCSLAACSATAGSSGTNPDSNPQIQSPAPVRTSPLTGLPQPEAKPVLIVKLDNTRNAQPHAGLKDADVVYIEEVEYGITRLAAVFSSIVPDRIGPVRSARITDVDLVAQYGSPAFAFSGVQRKMWPEIQGSPLIDVSPNRNANIYFRDSSRRAPYNYFLDGVDALAFAPDATLDRDIGFVFSNDIPFGGKVNTGATMDWPGSSAEFTFNPSTGLYNVDLNGEPAEADENKAGQSAATVVIQNVKQSPSAYYDRGGGNTPHASTIGKGTAVILRDGLSYDVKWSRPTEDVGTTFTMADGSPMPFKPGQQWVVLLDKERPATLLPEPSPAPSSSKKKGTAQPSPSTSSGASTIRT
ncbi:MAG: DUF3048 domain-containing protein [Actinomycetota bacterium]|nr:DUF3048 domain-containing protein [Actinomycetota bacterium]